MSSSTIFIFGAGVLTACLAATLVLTIGTSQEQSQEADE
jgi:hypothetical protein